MLELCNLLCVPIEGGPLLKLLHLFDKGFSTGHIPWSVFQLLPWSAQALPNAKAASDGKIVFERPYKRMVKPNFLGWALMLFFIAALIFYIYVRAAKTLNLGAKFIWYALAL